MKLKIIYLLLFTAHLSCKNPKPQLPKVNVYPQEIITSTIEISVNPLCVWGAFKGELLGVRLFTAMEKIDKRHFAKIRAHYVCYNLGI